MKRNNYFFNNIYISKSIEHWNLCSSDLKADDFAYKIFYFQNLNLIYTVLESELKLIFPEKKLIAYLNAEKKIRKKKIGYMSKIIFFLENNKKNYYSDKSIIRIKNNNTSEMISALKQLRDTRNEMTHDFINKFNGLKIDEINKVIYYSDLIINYFLDLKNEKT